MLVCGCAFGLLLPAKAGNREFVHLSSQVGMIYPGCSFGDLCRLCKDISSGVSSLDCRDLQITRGGAEAAALWGTGVVRGVVASLSVLAPLTYKHGGKMAFECEETICILVMSLRNISVPAFLAFV